MPSENEVTPKEYIAKLRETLINKTRNLELEIHRGFDDISKLVSILEQEIERASNEVKTDTSSTTTQTDL